MFNDSVAHKEFFGREDVLSLLDKRVSALKEGYRQNIAITGQRLAGKTHLLHHFLDQLKDPALLPIYVEVINEPFTAFAERFIGTLLHTFLKVRGEEVIDDYEYLLQKARNYIPHTVDAILEIKKRLSEKDFNAAYTDILNITSIVKKETGTRCIVIFDEFQNLNFFGIKEPFSHFGKVIMVQKDTMYIISSSDKFAIQKILAEKLFLLFGNFELIELKGFVFNSSKEFLDKKLDGFHLNEGLRSFLIAFTDGNPFYMDLACTKIRELALVSSTNIINTNIIVDAIEDLYFNSKGTINQYFTNLINSLYINQATLNAVISIAKGAHTLKEIRESLKISFAETSLRLNKLIELNIIFKNGSFYFFSDKGFLFWIKEVYDRKRTSLISSVAMRVEQFKHDMHTHLSKFLFNLRKDPPHRVSELFTHFKGEILELSGKRHKLPTFKKIDTIRLDRVNSILLAYKDKKLWAFFIKEGRMDEEDVLLFMKEIKQLKLKVMNKILIPLDGININATLLAKENKMWIWNLKSLNFIIDIYNQEKIIRYT